MQPDNDKQRIKYYAQQMEEGYLFMERMRQYPVEECGEPLASLAIVYLVEYNV